jgi:GNAT superfamily N-acetyltransferase
VSVQITALSDPDAGHTNHRLAWLAAEDGIPVGAAFLRLFDAAGQAHLGDLELNVHPAERRRGVGSLLLERAVAAARSEGRRTVVAQTAGDSAGEFFLPARGFRMVLTLIYARLVLEAADLRALAAAVAQEHPGYRLVSWDGLVPEHLTESFAASRVAMDDMPMDDTDYGAVTWDVARVKAAARAVADRGQLLHTVVALNTSDGTVAGFTELVVPGDGTGDGQCYGTAVLPTHRGRGLAGWMKALSIVEAAQRHPRLGGLVTDTAQSNVRMRAINDALGFIPTHQELQYQLDL